MQCDSRKSITTSNLTSTSSIGRTTTPVPTSASSSTNNLRSTASGGNDLSDNALSIQRIDNVVTEMQKYLDEKFSEIREIAKIINDHGQRINRIEDEQKTLTFNTNNLDVRVDNIEQAALSNSIEINGVPMNQPDDLSSIILKIASIISFTTSSEDWSRIYRQFRQSNQDRPPSIIIFFKDQLKRDQFLAAAKKNRGLSSSKIGIDGRDSMIYVNENLTKARRKLFYTAKAFKDRNKFKYLWTSKGKIYLRKNDGCQAINVNFYTNFEKIDSDDGAS